MCVVFPTQVSTPMQYRKEVRQELEADANSSNLNKLGPYYYMSGIKLLDFEMEDVQTIAEVLSKVGSCHECTQYGDNESATATDYTQLHVECE